MPYKDPEKARQAKRDSKRKKSIERGTFGMKGKHSRPIRTEKQLEESKKNRKEKAKIWNRIYSELNTEKKLLWAAKRRAKNRGLDFTIEESDIIIPEYCPYLNIKLQIKNRTIGSCRDSWPTLDRINNSLGYIKGNIEVISFKANTMKNNAIEKELLSFATEILKRHESRNH